MTIKESANGEKYDIKPLIYTNPVPSFIGNDENQNIGNFSIKKV